MRVRGSGTDTKWAELSSLLGEIFTIPQQSGQVVELEVVPYGAGPIPPPKPSLHQKLIIFTEHRDTLNYLEKRITGFLGRKESVVIIHGGTSRENRLVVQETFKHDPTVQVEQVRQDGSIWFLLHEQQQLMVSLYGVYEIIYGLIDLQVHGKR